MSLFYGFITGVVFGFLLQKGQVIRYDKQIAALRFLDMTIVKFMLSAILVAMVGLYLLEGMELIKFSLKPTILGSVITGGLLFGLGWGILGYCPGTSLGAIGEGRLDALSGILGMLVGAALFAQIYPWMQKTLLLVGNYGKITLPQVLGINPWIVIVLFWLAGVLLFRWFEQKGW
ncbi:MAG TPA: YeeE/YedE family protein [Desulfonauticus sp.]|nr:MAG: hypothetical protein XD41_0731 [Desulfonauticus sp. 38_4375]MDK2922360.1 uncharacterized protein [Desulfonauticus sp.]HCO12123.1 YeeE/YedE family protein [Desulfonauticus sp.]